MCHVFDRKSGGACVMLNNAQRLYSSHPSPAMVSVLNTGCCAMHAAGVPASAEITCAFKFKVIIRQSISTAGTGV
jgi:hypothetical protein